MRFSETATRAAPHHRDPRHEMNDVIGEQSGVRLGRKVELKADAEELGKQVADCSQKKQAEVLHNLKSHIAFMADLGLDLDETINEPFWRGTKY